MIVIYDSGMGGLTVLDEFVKKYPHQEFLYIGDTEYCPYGSKTESEIQERVRWVLQTVVLPRKDVSLLVLACNTISALCMEDAKRLMTCPVVGTIEAAVEQATRHSKEKRVSLWATEATVRSHVYEEKGEKQGLHIKAVSCPRFVPLMEDAGLPPEEKYRLLKIEIQKMLQNVENSSDVLIYGCTHYPMLEPLLRELEDTQEWAWIRRMQRVNPAQLMAEQSHIHTSRAKGSISWYITGDERLFFSNARQWMHAPWLEEAAVAKR